MRTYPVGIAVAIDSSVGSFTQSSAAVGDVWTSMGFAVGVGALLSLMAFPFLFVCGVPLGGTPIPR